MIKLMGFFLLMAMSMAANAAECVSGCGDVTLTFPPRTLSIDENRVGQQINSSIVPDPYKTVRYNAGTAAVIGIWNGDSIPPVGTHPTTWQFKKVDDYSSIALRLAGPCEILYWPFNSLGISKDDNCGPINYSEGELVEWGQSPIQAILRIDRKIISGSYTKKIPIAQWITCQPYGCMNKQVVLRNIYVDVDIVVPQSCVLNVGQVINIDFGNISSGAFKTAGAVAQGVQPKSKTVSVKCDNIAGNSQLTMRLQADKTNGNIVVSDENNDVGFRVTNNSGTPLIPNNLSSVIPFTLDSNARQNVTIQAYPVSVTGNKPAEGPVTARGYLRVDFP